ncbi:alpha-L RNA-binding motif-containing protein [Tilletiaria anomala UBC 951]|uniref:Alpha-L RNA-binding motif-containing protein n=1 Tax=Tilletiaria anomala (strain ATCC 24038 / CBS 436.72 / UBC 951) TaxID=1037660 RepID=A0A066VBQ9_TILAU|nr:alpha-L RNA-binding motif-containing protein [Tilletiaria anomala UBC 951]KDN36199.1 alpha-L RNA-binding motif-containing protein [Tilletiaria anomala UBC 951]
MRKANVFSHDPKAIIPRMSWSKENLYNLLLRSTNPFHMGALNFNRTALTMYQQRWRSKRFLRGYHGDWIPERRFKRWLVPDRLPRFDQRSSLSALVADRGANRPGLRASSAGASVGGSRLPFTRSRILTQALASAGREIGAEERMPTASLFVRDVERRLDVVLFRCCFAVSAYQARAAIVQGHVKLNGFKVTDPNKLLEPGDLLSITPTAIPMLEPKKAARIRAQIIKRRNKSWKRILLKLQAERQSKESTEAAYASAAGAVTESKAEAVSGSVAASESESQKVAPQDEAAPTQKEPIDVAADQVEGGASRRAATSSSPSSSSPEASSDSKGGAESTDRSGVRKGKKKSPPLPPGVLFFRLPQYAAPFLFIPPYLEVSFSTCSAIYLRHPTIVPAAPSARQQLAEQQSADQEKENSSGSRRASSPPSNVMYRTDIASPYPAGGDMYSMAWEHYARDAPRTRSDVRRIKVEAAHGRNGFESARAKDAYKTVRALRRGKTAAAARA